MIPISSEFHTLVQSILSKKVAIYGTLKGYPFELVHSLLDSMGKQFLPGLNSQPKLFCYVPFGVAAMGGSLACLHKAM